MATGTLLAVAALMLSDRAPGALRRVFGDAADRLSARIDASERLPNTDQLPESDVLVHVGLWAAVALLVGWTVWTWRGLLIGSLMVLVASAVVELAQGRYSSGRAFESSDLTANAIGVAAGASLAALGYLLWSGAAALADAVGRREPNGVGPGR